MIWKIFQVILGIVASLVFLFGIFFAEEYGFNRDAVILSPIAIFILALLKKGIFGPVEEESSQQTNGE